MSASFASIPGPSVAANYTINSTIAGRPVIGAVSQTASGGSVVVNLIQPGTVFLDYQNRLDLRIGKNFHVGSSKFYGYIDIYNVGNAGTVTSVNQTYAGPTSSWMNPLTIVDGRYIRFGLQVNF